MALRWFVASSGSGGWSQECPAGRSVWPSNEQSAHRISVSVWLGTGTAPRFWSARRDMSCPARRRCEVFIIGIDPHKGSHMAAVLDPSERVIDQVRVRADRQQRDRLLAFAARFEPRWWAVEGAAGVQRRRLPVPDRWALRPLQRHRADRRVLRPEPASPAQPARQPSTQPRHPHGGRDPGA